MTQPTKPEPWEVNLIGFQCNNCGKPFAGKRIPSKCDFCNGVEFSAIQKPVTAAEPPKGGEP